MCLKGNLLTSKESPTRTACRDTQPKKREREKGGLIVTYAYVIKRNPRLLLTHRERTAVLLSICVITNTSPAFGSTSFLFLTHFFFAKTKAKSPAGLIRISEKEVQGILQELESLSCEPRHNLTRV